MQMEKYLLYYPYLYVVCSFFNTCVSVVRLLYCNTRFIKK